MERGHGRRRAVFSDYTFAIRASEEDSTLLDVGKVIREEIQAVAQNPDEKDKVEKIKKLGTDFDKLGQEVEAAIGQKN